MGYPIKAYRHQHKVRGKVTFTPDFLAEELFEIVRRPMTEFLDAVNPELGRPIVLDTSVGAGALLKPFKQAFGDRILTVGFDIVDYAGREACDVFIQKSWMHSDAQDLDFSKVAFVCQNPPFSDFEGLEDVSKRQWIAGAKRTNKSTAFIPDLFLTRLDDLCGTQPGPWSYIITPMGFRLNQRLVSKRRFRYAESKTQIITGVASLPIDVFEDTKFHAEVLYFNVPGIAPHTWAGFPVKNQKIF